ncbi:MAG: ATP-binding protein [Leptolyngbyaceae bacterium]|nr:ATP-binding protein [Leptolyngbyaceae bacterium]
MASPTCHMLIGPPGCGKSTLARRWVEQFPPTVWVSTDAIRQTLYGDARIQGDWSKIEAEVIRQIKGAIALHRPVIYDATNAHRDWRIDLLQKLSDEPVRWIGWVFHTPLAVCQQRNQQRERHVDAAVIEQFHHWLEDSPPSPSEGFAAIHPVPMKGNDFNLELIHILTQSLQP